MEARARLFDQVRDRLRTLHYSYRTEQQYLGWIRRFILFHHKRHPAEMGGAEVEAFLSHLAVDRKVSAPTQNQALAAILFLYRHVLEIELPWLESIVRAKPSRHLPVVLTASKGRSVLANLRGEYRLIGSLLYGGGLRLLEALRLRVKDIEFEYRQIVVRDGKGAKDRVTVLPDGLVGPLREHLEHVEERHRLAMQHGHGGASSFRMRSSASTRMPQSLGAGSTYFRRARPRGTRVLVRGGAITFSRARSNGRSPRRSEPPGS